MKIAYTIVALIAAAVVKAQTPTFTNCAPANADLTINTFSISPYPLCVGKQVCATGTGTLHAPVTTGATLNILGTVLGSPVYTDTQDLCTILAAATPSTPCPVPTTVTSITACVLVKPTAPVGLAVTLKVSATNGGGSTLFCQTANGVKAANC